MVPRWGRRSRQILFVSPSVSEMLSTKPADIDGRDFLDYVFREPQVTS